jgi:hypothetical protein
MRREEREAWEATYISMSQSGVQSQARPQMVGPFQASNLFTYMYKWLYDHMAMAVCICDCSTYSVYMS